MKLLLVLPGKFLMGSPQDEEGRSDDERQHEGEITRPFYLGVHEVTQGQWRAVMGKHSNPSFHSKTGRKQNSVKGFSERELDDFPAENISGQDVQCFLKKLNGPSVVAVIGAVLPPVVPADRANLDTTGAATCYEPSRVRIFTLCPAA